MDPAVITTVLPAAGDVLQVQDDKDLAGSVIESVAGVNGECKRIAVFSVVLLFLSAINAIPSIMVKYVQGTPTAPQVEGNLKSQYRDLFWLGGSYHHKDGYAAMIGLNAGDTFNIGYAYDFTKTRLNTASNGTHELIIGFLLNNKYSETCPRCNWQERREMKSSYR